MFNNIQGTSTVSWTLFGKGHNLGGVGLGEGYIWVHENNSENNTRSVLGDCVKVEVAILGSTSLMNIMVSAGGRKATLNWTTVSEVRSCEKVEMAGLGSTPLIVLTFSMDVKQLWARTPRPLRRFDLVARTSGTRLIVPNRHLWDVSTYFAPTLRTLLNHTGSIDIKTCPKPRSLRRFDLIAWTSWTRLKRMGSMDMKTVPNRDL